MSIMICRKCGHKGVRLTYFCPECGEHDDHMYRKEHRNPKKARFMSRADIIAEYRDAGMPFR